MSDPDMDAPVTRRELHDALGIFGGALRADIRADIMHDINAHVVPNLRGAIMHDVVTQVVPDIITQVKALLKVLEDKLMTELRVQVHGSSDRFEERLSVIDDKYKDLPGRVSKLEANVFPPSPKRNRRRAR